MPGGLSTPRNHSPASVFPPYTDCVAIPVQRIIAVSLFAAASWAQQTPPDGPWNHRILLASSPDGLSWTLHRQVLAERASVPELFLAPGTDRRPTILFVNATNGPNRPTSIGALQLENLANPTGGGIDSWKPVETNLPPNAVDPNIIRLAGDSTLRLYVKADQNGSIAAYETTGDGLADWRPLGEVFRDPRFPNATDPDVFELPDGQGFVMLLSLGPRFLRCTSPDGLRFTTDGTMIDLGGSVSDTVKLPAGGWRTYFHVNPNPAAGITKMHIRSAFTADGKSWTLEPGIRVQSPEGEGPAIHGVADPAPMQLPDGTWLMAIKSFIAAPQQQQQQQPPSNGLQGHHVLSATSTDGGLTWTRDPGIRLSGASVPAAIHDVDNGRVIVYFVQPPNEPGKPETVAAAVSTDGTNFRRDPAFRIEGLSTLKAVDPSILRDEDGRYRLYYLASDHPGDPAAGPNPHAIRLALSDDGITFREVPDTAFEYPDLVDPDVFRAPNGDWLMYVFAGSRGTIIARSTDGGRKFQYEGVLSPAGWGTTAPIRLPDGRLRLYAFDQRTPAGNVVRSFLSGDGIHWEEEPGERLRANPGEQITDPFVIPWREGTYKMYFKSNAPPGAFATGQSANLVLGAPDFNDAGGPTLFNHPSGLATDGTALLLADRWNHRVLIWKTAPSKSNTPPDLVLGQPDFKQNHSGQGTHQMNWPGNVAITPDGGRIAIADTNNNRILIWNAFPERNGAPADRIIDLTRLQQQPQPGVMPFGWPWGVWTDGRKLAVVATNGRAVLIWNSLPERDHQPPDFVFRPSGTGTPRNITSDGESYFALSDHNYGPESRPATMLWGEFPSAATPVTPTGVLPEWLKGSPASNGRWIFAGMQSVYLFDSKPVIGGGSSQPAVTLQPTGYRNGDGPDAVVAQGRLYVCNYNGNNVLGWNSIPSRPDQQPDFSLGSETPAQDTWSERFFIQNPALATDGKSLFASSDFDRKLFVWRNLPEISGQPPDAVIGVPDAPWDIAVHRNRLALAGKRAVFLWNTLPFEGQPRPDVIWNGRIGDVEFRELTGVAMDDRYFYLADRMANRIYVWPGVPGSAPSLPIEMQNPGKLTSNGEYLVAAPFEGNEILVWKVADLAAGGPNTPVRIGRQGQFNLPGEALATPDGRFFVADRSNNRVHVWNRIEDALAGRDADAFLGARDGNDRSAGTATDKMYMPGSLAYDGKNLWVGEFKFATRILRFSAN
jgi:hypothetical protein